MTIEQLILILERYPQDTVVKIGDDAMEIFEYHYQEKRPDILKIY